MEFIPTEMDTMVASICIIIAVVVPLFVIFYAIGSVGSVVAGWFRGA